LHITARKILAQHSQQGVPALGKKAWGHFSLFFLFLSFFIFQKAENGA
jgi:hypothetical protein